MQYQTSSPCSTLLEQNSSKKRTTQSKIKKNQIHACTFDLSKANDRIERKNLWKMMATLKIDILLLKAIISTYQNQTMQIKIGGTKSNPTTLINGLRQGSELLSRSS